MKAYAAVLDAQAEYEAAAAERRRNDPRGLKAREEIAEAKLLAAQEVHAEEQATTDAALQAAYAEHQGAMELITETLTAFVEARARLTEAEAALATLEARARRLGIPIPPYDSLAFRATRDAEVNALQQRARQVTLNGFYGAR